MAKYVETGHGHEEEGALSGVMGIRDVQDVILIRHSYVRTERRGRGIGSGLLRHLLALAERPVMIGTWEAALHALTCRITLDFHPAIR